MYSISVSQVKRNFVPAKSGMISTWDPKRCCSKNRIPFTKYKVVRICHIGGLKLTEYNFEWVGEAAVETVFLSVASPKTIYRACDSYFSISLNTNSFYGCVLYHLCPFFSLPFWCYRLCLIMSALMISVTGLLFPGWKDVLYTHYTHIASANLLFQKRRWQQILTEII